MELMSENPSNETPIEEESVDMDKEQESEDTDIADDADKADEADGEYIDELDGPTKDED